MKLRIEESAWQVLSHGLRDREDVETAGVILAEPLDGGDVLVARHLLQVPEEGYAIRKVDQLQVDPVTLNRLVHRARREGLSVITVHTHPRTSEPYFSRADDLGDERLMPAFYVQSPGPHGSMVLAGASGEASARVWRQELGPEELELRIVGKSLGMTLRGSSDASSDEPWFSRQRLALGADGQVALRGLHVGVVGLGGTGSVSTVQLAHLGVGSITLVEGDVVEDSNISRIVGASTADARGERTKVEVARRYVESLGLDTKVRGLCGRLGNEIGVDELASCDVILSCVDKHSPRALLNRLSYTHLVPVIDMGSAFRVDHTGSVSSGAGRVVVIGPGKPCLACWGHLDPRELYIESLSASERAEQAADGYIAGADVPQPSVIPFNTLVSGAAVVELLRLVTAFSGAEDPPDRLAFDFGVGSVRRNRLALRAECNICGGEPQTGAGIAVPAVGVGDTR